MVYFENIINIKTFCASIQNFVEEDLIKDYLTVLNETSIIFEEKKSKFISYVKPIQNEDEATSFIQQIRTKHWDATHNVFAYDIFDQIAIQRSSDDGEPQGTAGLPVMEVIKKNGIRNIVIVVTRYFGGTMLGSGGLIRAYGKSASLGIEAAKIVRKILCSEFFVNLDYTLSGKLQNAILSNQHNIQEINYSDNVEFVVIVPESEEKTFLEYVVEATFGRAIIKKEKSFYSVFNSDGKLIN